LSKVGSLLNLRWNITIELTFEDVQGSVQPSAGTYGNNNSNNNNALYASRDSLSGSGMYDSRLGGNAAASWEVHTHAHTHIIP